MATVKILLGVLACAVLAGTGATGRAGSARRASARQGSRERLVVGVDLELAPRVIALFRSDSVTVSGITAHSVDVRPLGAIDSRGLAYVWTPYPWHRLRLQRGTWRGTLPAPALLGIYRLQVRLDHGRKFLTSTSWLMRVFPHGTETRRSFPTPRAVVRDFVAHLPGHQVLVALKPWPLAKFDHRDPRLHRAFVIAYAPRSDSHSSGRLGVFITAVRDGFHGRWRLLEVTTGPYDGMRRVLIASRAGLDAQTGRDEARPNRNFTREGATQGSRRLG